MEFSHKRQQDVVTFKSFSHRPGPLCKGGGKEIRGFGDVKLQPGEGLCMLRALFIWNEGSSLGAFWP